MKIKNTAFFSLLTAFLSVSSATIAHGDGEFLFKPSRTGSPVKGAVAFAAAELQGGGEKNSPVAQPPIDISRDFGEGGKPTVTWNGVGILQRSSNLKNWAPLYDATTPYVTSPTGTFSRRFFRVAKPLPPCPGSNFDLTAVSWKSTRNHTSQSFSDQFGVFAEQGFRVIDIEVYDHGNNTRLGAVWQKNLDNRKWASLRNLTSAQFHDKWLQYRDGGFRLIDQETYLLNGNIRYAGVWEENIENVGWASFRNLTNEQFSEKFQLYRNTHVPIDVEGYILGGQLRYSVIWVQGCDLDWKILRNMTSEQYSEKFQTFADQGFRVAKFASYRNTNGQQRYAAIWMANTSNRNWLMLRNMTATVYGEKWQEFRDDGYRVIDFEAYQTNNGVRFAAVWRENVSSN